ncbi:MAG: hypothetical protein WA091_00470 [Minisyncoccales bacterium]
MQTVVNALLNMVPDIGAQRIFEILGPIPSRVDGVLVAREGEGDFAGPLYKALNPSGNRIIEEGKDVYSAVWDIREFRHTRVIIAIKKIDDAVAKEIVEALVALRRKVIIEGIFIVALDDLRSFKGGFKVITPGG